ncbi:uncharacterized protein LOC134258250 [Saccostrea cucullata]|uniref:uncharacterized protein LOC134258250 n=1 Tax=Saccostrea cuccullata TaxID=36930 RepID=UPI002ED12DFE
MEGRLKAIRAGNRSAVTKLFGRFLDLKENTASEVTEEIEIIRKSLTQKRQTLQELNERILDALSEEDIEEEITNTDEYMYELDCKIKKTETFTEKVSCKTLNASAECFVPTLEIHDSNVNTSAAINSSETACENILNNFPASDLNEQSNQAQLRDAAAQTIAGFTLTNANYETAIDLLKERFGQPQKIINGHMRALMELQAPRNDAISLRNYGDCLESHVRSLECLGQKQEMYGALLIPVIMNKLPAEIRKNIAREYDGDNISLLNLRKAISKEVKILESGQIENSDGFHATAMFLTGASKKQRHVHYGQNQKTKESTPYIETTEIKSRPCIYCCTENHFPGDCKKVTEVSARFDILKRKKLCFNCLGNHRAADCKSRNRCKKCQKKHHTSICDMKQTKDKDEPTRSTSVNIVETSKKAETTVLNVEHRPTNVLLKTAIAPVSHENQTTDANILFDEGSQRSFITEKLANELEITRRRSEAIKLSTFGENGSVQYLDSATINLITDSGELIAINVLIVPSIASPLSSYHSSEVKRLPYLQGLKLAHPVSIDSEFVISFLIGADFYWRIVENQVIRGSGPTAVKSKIGFLLSGPTSQSSYTNSARDHIYNVIAMHTSVEQALERFWELENIGITDTPDKNDSNDKVKMYQDKCIEFRDDKYYAKLPWKDDHSELPSNYGIALKRTQSTINRLSSNPELLKKYSAIIEEQERKGFIEKVPEDTKTSSVVHYIPHHYVKKDSSTTPIRIVYDCSCRESRDKPSLNDCLDSTPPILNDLTSILTRFRLHEFAVTTDIEKAFLHVGLHENDRDATRFLWLKDPNDVNSSLVPYRFKAVLFGATCSPFILDAFLFFPQQFGEGKRKITEKEYQGHGRDNKQNANLRTRNMELEKSNTELCHKHPGTETLIQNLADKVSEQKRIECQKQKPKKESVNGPLN